MTRPRICPKSVVTVVLSWIVTSLSACSTQGGLGANPDGTRELGSSELRIESLSTKPYLVTGGDVLLRVDAGQDLDLADVSVSANGQDVTAAFHPADGGGLVGLVGSLPLGESTISAQVVEPQVSASLELTNYPITGPIISGPQEDPFLCQTEDFITVTGESLGPPLDEACSVETRVDYVYYSTTAEAFRPLDPGRDGEAPEDLAYTMTLDGVRAPLIVRVQTGTINRAIYESAVLHDPSDPVPDPWSPSRAWNGKLVYTHGGGCRSGWFRQGNVTGGVLQKGLLEMGYALTSASFNRFGNNCNDLLASETHIMVKERFVESYGIPTYTIGTGSSGGSYQSHQTADNYPGVFDGIIVASSFPDVTSATIFTLGDSRLLYHYFTEVAHGEFTDEQQRLLAGFGSWGSIANLSRGAARIDATYSETATDEAQGAEVALPKLEPLRYSPSNPDGIRATVYDHTINVYGVDPSTGFAARPLDNHGVQYGLAVLNSGDISGAQFLALNRDIGGYDADLNHVPTRHRANPAAARRAFGTGRILYGGAGLAETPVIDYREYRDHREQGDIHMIVHQFTTRARIAEANGHANNHVMNIGGLWGFTEAEPDLGDLFRQMDRWLMSVRADESSASLAQKVERARPTDLVDGCWDTRGEGPVRVNEPLATDGTGVCSEIFPVYSTPRQVAGAPLTNRIVTCQLRPLDSRDYVVEFTEDEWNSLEAIFPDGVCDWARGDAHAEGYQGTWLSFGPSEVNRAR